MASYHQSNHFYFQHQHNAFHRQFGHGAIPNNTMPDPQTFLNLEHAYFQQLPFNQVPLFQGPPQHQYPSLLQLQQLIPANNHPEYVITHQDEPSDTTHLISSSPPSPMDFHLSRQPSTTTISSDYFGSETFLKQEQPSQQQHIRNASKGLEWVSHFESSSRKSDEPNERKVRLPSISDIRTFNFIPQPPVEKIVLRNSTCHSLKKKLSIIETQLLKTKVNKKPVQKNSSSPITKVNEDFKIIKPITQSSVSKVKNYQILKEKATFFTNVELTDRFIARNIMRDPELKQHIDKNKTVQEFELSQDDILKFKIYDFLFEYLNLKDDREEYLNDKSNFEEEYENVVFNVGIKFELKIPKVVDSDDEFINYDDNDRNNEDYKDKTVSIFIKLVKPSESELDKSQILQSLQIQFDEFFTKNATNKQRRRRSRKIFSKPRWGVGYEDELTVLHLKIEVD